MKFLPICVIVISGCCATQPTTIPHPSCETPPNITRAEWDDLYKLRDAMSRDVLLYEECIAAYKGRIDAFNE